MGEVLCGGGFDWTGDHGSGLSCVAAAPPQGSCSTTGAPHGSRETFLGGGGGWGASVIVTGLPKSKSSRSLDGLPPEVVRRDLAVSLKEGMASREAEKVDWIVSSAILRRQAF